MNAQIVSFRCVLTDKLGRFVSSSVNNDVINQLESGSQTLKGLVAGLQNVRAGEKRKLFVPAGEAYGLYDPTLVVELPRMQLARGESLMIGDEIAGQYPETGPVRTFRVVKAAAAFVVLDGNHPLAGQDLYFEVEITAARKALPEDLFEDSTVFAGGYLH